jgi:hypothetical protein
MIEFAPPVDDYKISVLNRQLVVNDIHPYAENAIGLLYHKLYYFFLSWVLCT